MRYPPTYRPTITERDRYMEALQLFAAKVLTVDVDRKRLTLEDLRTGLTYTDVQTFPDTPMPERGKVGLCANLENQGGFYETSVVSWMAADTVSAIDAIAHRAIDHKDLRGYNERKRLLYRKPYAGQQTVTHREGFSEKHDDGWDKLAADSSRDRLDPLSRTRTEVTSLRRGYTDAGQSMQGRVERPGASGVVAENLPDGTVLGTVYLTPGAQATDRYVSGAPDVLPYSERTIKVQEFGLDYPVPADVLGSALLDEVLGVTGDPWGRTAKETTGQVSFDDQTFLADQSWDHPYHTPIKAVGPTLNEGLTPKRRGYILERSEGTLVGSNRFDTSTYGKVLKPVVFPLTTLGRFGSDVESGYLAVTDSADHAEARLAASASSTRFPAEYNTTRWDVTKEGMLVLDVGSTLPKENIPLAGGYEHPHGAGRSVEASLTGSLKLVVGKNRDEEDAIDLQALGQTVLRLGADDASLPNAGRTVMTQVRSQSDVLASRTLQYWTTAKLSPGDAGDLEAKTGAENVSLRGAFDGAAILRLGARNPKALRRHMMNGYADGPGRQALTPGSPSRQDSRSPGRPTYAPGDSTYAFHDLTTAGKSAFGLSPYSWSGAPVANMDQHGLSLDVHAVRDALVRLGANEASGQSLLLDLAGGLVAALGKDQQGRSITATLDGGVEMVLGMNSTGTALQVEFNGDVNWLVKGNFHLNVTGDSVFESTSHTHIAKTDYATKCQTHTAVALARHTTEAPDIVGNQGLYDSAVVS